VQGEEEWDLAPSLRCLPDHLSTPGFGDEYYDILIEFAKLPRSAWREVKKRIGRCIEKVAKDEFALPYRIVCSYTGCGFVFIPVQSEFVANPDWPSIRVRALQQLTRAHKYDQHLSKSVGILVARSPMNLEIWWCLVAHEWAYDPAIQEALENNFPFRRVKGAEVQGYVFNP
jgi:hypothetical protein